MNNWIEIYITDKTGSKFFRNSVTLSPFGGLNGVRRSLERHINRANISPDKYAFLDAATARIEISSDLESAMNDDDLLKQLEL